MAVSVTLYETEIEALLSLPEEQRGRILTAILCDATGKEYSEMDASDNVIFTLVNAQVKRAAKLSSKRKQSAKTRWQNQTNSGSDDTQEEQNNTSAMQNDTNAMQNQAKESNGDTNLCTNTNTITNTDTNTITNTSKNTEATAASQAERCAACPYEKIKDLYNSTCGSFAKIRSIDGTRKTAVAARWKACPQLSTFEELFKIAEDSDFLKGGGEKKWKADFDWMMKATNFSKILEHRYDNQEKSYNSSFSVKDMEDIAIRQIQRRKNQSKGGDV